MGKVFGGDDGTNPRMGLSPAGIYGLNPGVSVRTTQNPGMQQASQLEISAILGASGDFIHPVWSHRTFTNYVVLNLG
jgi:hypothetical protein